METQAPKYFKEATPIEVGLNRIIAEKSIYKEMASCEQMDKLIDLLEPRYGIEVMGIIETLNARQAEAIIKYFNSNSSMEKPEKGDSSIRFTGTTKLEMDLNRIIEENEIYFGKATIKQRNYLLDLLGANTGENVKILVESLNKEQAGGIIDYMVKHYTPKASSSNKFIYGGLGVLFFFPGLGALLSRDDQPSGFCLLLISVVFFLLAFFSKSMTVQNINTNRNTNRNETSDKSRVVYVILALFLGLLGIHNFYIGRSNAGVLQILLSILFFPASIIWCLYDICSQTTDSDGKPLS